MEVETFNGNSFMVNSEGAATIRDVNDRTANLVVVDVHREWSHSRPRYRAASTKLIAV